MFFLFPGRGKHVVIWEVPHFIHKKKKKKKTGPTRALQILYKFPIQSWCTCMCFSEDASFFGYGTTDGRLRLHETSNGSQFQHFQPTDLTAPKVQGKKRCCSPRCFMKKEEKLTPFFSSE